MVSMFRIAGWLEGASFLILLLIAMPLKYIFSQPEYVSAVGMAHGALFLFYVLLSVYAGNELNWPLKTRFYVILASILPLGPFVFDHKYLSSTDPSS